jgi:hypothetical protein
MPYRYEATEKFWAVFYRLGDSQKESVRRIWKIFRQDPFDARLTERRGAIRRDPFGMLDPQ